MEIHELIGSLDSTERIRLHGEKYAIHCEVVASISNDDIVARTSVNVLLASDFWIRKDQIGVATLDGELLATRISEALGKVRKAKSEYIANQSTATEVLSGSAQPHV